LVSNQFLINELVATFIRVDNHPTLAIIRVTAIDNEVKCSVSRICISDLTSEKVILWGQVLTLKNEDSSASWLWKHNTFESFSLSDGQLTKKSSLVEVPTCLTQLIKGMLEMSPSGPTWRFESETLEAVAEFLWNVVKARDRLKSIPSRKATKSFPC
jgi:hypothetical protein